MKQKTWELRNTKQVTNHICCNCQDSITHHSHYNDERFCEECKIQISTDYKEQKKNKDEYITRFGVTLEEFLDSVYEEIIPKYYGIDERF